MSIVIIAEKPSVARDIAKVVGATSRGDGFLEGGGYRVSWAVGHLLELCQPDAYDPSWKRWSTATLPMVPDAFRYRPRRGGAKQLSVLKRLIRGRDTRGVINACDAGREGELIFRLVWDHAVAGLSRPPGVKRLWISSLTTQAIRAGLNNLKPGAAYDRLADAARCRSEADWLVGMNGTRALTLLGRRAGGSELMSLGRVQTPTLAMLVNRERAIEQFVAEPFWQVKARFVVLAAGEGHAPSPPAARSASSQAQEMSQAAAGQTYDGQWFRGRQDRLPSAATAKAIVDAVANKRGTIISCERKEAPRRPPLLYDLTNLQKAANRRLGFSADRTLKTAQALYEKHKAITYPRTDSRFLTTDMRAGLPNIVSALNQQGMPWRPAAAAAQARGARVGGSVIRDKAVGDHHAIIPTLKVPAPGKLGADERRLYELIVQRFLAVFLPDVVYAKTRLVTQVGDHTFLSLGRVRTQEGWHLAEPPPKKPPKPKPGEPVAAATLPLVETGTPVGCERAAARESKTEPPPRYSEATLLSAMEGAGKELDDEALRAAMRGSGLGTPATRASIIETLLRREYIRRKGKQLQATPRGCSLVEALPSDALRSPELTGRWESRLATMASGGSEHRGRFMDDIIRFTTTLVSEMKAAEPPREIAEAAAEVLGRCPVCGGDVTAGRSAYKCASGRECTFVIMKRIAGRQTSPGLVRLLLAGKTSQPLKGFRSKKGKRFSAALKLDAEGTVVFEFAERKSSSRQDKPAASKSAPSKSTRPKAATKRPAKKAPAGPPKCPECRQGQVMRGRRGWGCTRWREGCGFVVWFEQGSIVLPDDEADRLFRKKQTRLLAGLSDDGKARLVLDLDVEGNVRVELSKRTKRKV